jgi:Nif-specific regulatory protein
MSESLSRLKLRVLYDISQIIGQALNLDQTLEYILSILSEYLSMNRGTITLMDPDKFQLGIRASHGLNQQERKRGVYGLDEGVTGRIFRTSQPFVVPDVSKEPLFLNKTGSRDIDKGQIAFIGVPIVVNSRPVGVLSVDRLFGDDVSFEEDMKFLTILGALTAQLISLNYQVDARENKLIRANLSLKADLSKKCSSFFELAHSPSMVAIQKLIKKVALTNATVLILGESGTGKTLVAQIIHETSSRSRSPFIKVNCAALPDNLLESELFGYEKGAFTGAVDKKIGRVEEANGGTIFLDEIGDLSTALQVKLLRFIQEREFERLGSNGTRTVDVRIIAATNRDLAAAVQEGAFRQDLYYRLNVFPVSLPAMRERREDIQCLISFFSDKIYRQYGSRLHFSIRALDALNNYSWPGNVREIENLMERLAIIWESNEIDLEHLRPYLFHDSGTYTRRTPRPTYEPSTTGSLKDMERTRVVDALERNNWIQSRAARELGLTLRQMGYRVKKFGLEETFKQKRSIR